MIWSSFSTQRRKLRNHNLDHEIKNPKKNFEIAPLAFELRRVGMVSWQHTNEMKDFI